MNSRRYVSVILCAFALACAVVTTGLVLVEPFQGDLTRIGGFREAQFRWTAPQHLFKEPRTSSAQGLGDYSQPYDILVIGDSFTQHIYGQCYGWQEVVYELTGLRILTIHQDHLDVARLFSHPVFLNSPPRHVIVEAAEMGLSSKLEGMDAMPASALLHRAGAEGIPLPALSPPPPRQRIQCEWQSGARLDMDATIHFYRLQFKQLFGASSKSFLVPLRPGFAPFTSPCQDSMLVYYGDLWKFEVSPAAWARARDRFEKFRAQVEANRFSRFHLLIAPDRSSVYAEAIAPNPSLTPRSLGQLTALFDNLPQIPAEKALKAAVAEGVKDVYLPDDSHWSWRGHAIVGEVVVRTLFPMGARPDSAVP